MPSTIHRLKCATHSEMFAVERAFEDFEEIRRYLAEWARLNVSDVISQMPDSIKDDIVVKICYTDEARELKRTSAQNCARLNEALGKAISGKCDFFAQFQGEAGSGSGCC